MLISRIGHTFDVLLWISVDCCQEKAINFVCRFTAERIVLMTWWIIIPRIWLSAMGLVALPIATDLRCYWYFKFQSIFCLLVGKQSDPGLTFIALPVWQREAWRRHQQLDVQHLLVVGQERRRALRTGFGNAVQWSIPELPSPLTSSGLQWHTRLPSYGESRTRAFVLDISSLDNSIWYCFLVE